MNNNNNNNNITEFMHYNKNSAGIFYKTYRKADHTVCSGKHMLNATNNESSEKLVCLASEYVKELKKTSSYKRMIENKKREDKEYFESILLMK